MAGAKIFIIIGVVLLVLFAIAVAVASIFVAQMRSMAGQLPTPAGPPKVVRTLGPADEPITGGVTWDGDELQVTADQAGSIRLFEVSLPQIDQAMLAYRFRIRTEDLEPHVYPEMWCRVAGFGEAFSRGMDRKVRGTNNWLTVDIPFYLQKDQFADMLRLNLVFEGPGTVHLKDIEVLATPLQAKAA